MNFQKKKNVLIAQQCLLHCNQNESKRIYIKELSFCHNSSQKKKTFATKFEHSNVCYFIMTPPYP